VIDILKPGFGCSGTVLAFNKRGDYFLCKKKTIGVCTGVDGVGTRRCVAPRIRVSNKNQTSGCRIED